MPINPRTLIAIFLLAFTVRAGWLIARLVQSGPVLEFPDEQQYWLMAESLAFGDGLHDELGFRATRMPLYPAVLSGFVVAPGGQYTTRVLHCLLGAIAAVLAAKLAAQIAGHPVAIIAGLTVAFDPFLVFFSSLLLTETPFIVALTALWVVLARMLRDGSSLRRWTMAGVLSAVCVYLRESSLLLIMLAFLTITLRFRTKEVLVHAIGAVAIVFVSLLPWAVRNKQVTGSFTLLTHRGGISLYDGVRPEADGSSDLGEVKQMPAVRGLSEVQWNKYFLNESFRLMGEDPGRIVRLAGVKLARTWNPVPNARDYRSAAVRLIGATWSIPLFAMATVGLVILWRRASGWLVLLLLLPAIYLSLLHAFFVGSVRYRLPAMPMLAVLAAVALGATLQRTRDHDAPAEIR